jgi:hypothetical protein
VDKGKRTVEIGNKLKRDITHLVGSITAIE